MRRDTGTNCELQKVGRALRDNLVRGLSGFTTERLDELSSLLTSVMVHEKPYTPRPGIHPSSLGGCPRKLFYELKGIEAASPVVDPNFKLKLEMSKIMHDWIQQKMSTIPENDIHMQHEVNIPEDSEAHQQYGIRGRCDTLISIGSGRPLVVIDYKFIADGSFSRLNSPEDKYIRQLTAYMNGFFCPMSLLVYINKRYMANKRIFPVYYDEAIWDSIVEEIEFVRESVRKDDLPPRRVDYFVCRNLCRYASICQPPTRSRL